MTNTKNPKFGDIFLIRFHPSYGEEFKKYRPGVILSSKINQIDNRFTLIAPLTSQVQNLKEHEILLPKLAFLKKETAIISWYIRTIDLNRLELKLGELPPNNKENLRTELISLIKE